MQQRSTKTSYPLHSSPLRTCTSLAKYRKVFAITVIERCKVTPFVSSDYEKWAPVFGK